MGTRRTRVARRLGVIAAAAVVVGSYFTGMAFAADGDGGSSTPPSSVSSGGSSGGSLVNTLEDAGVPGASDVTDGLNDAVDAVDPTATTTTAASGSCTGGIFVPVLGVCIPTTLPGIPGTSTTSPTGPSGSNTEVIYSPYPVPVFGDYGHRYYGRYYDHGCGCDRYAAPTYVPQTVVATQVASVPKGGVDTGDGSFQ